MMAERDRQVNTNETQEQSIGSKEERTPSGDRQDVSSEKSTTWQRMAKKIEGLKTKREEEKRVKQLKRAIDDVGKGKSSGGDVLTAVKRIVPAVAVGAGSLAGGAGVVEAARGDQVGGVEAQEGEQDRLMVYELSKLPLTDTTKETLAELRQTARVIVEGDSGDMDVYGLEVPMIEEGEGLTFPFEFDGERFSRMSERLQDWSGWLTRADGRRLETGDFSVSVVVVGDEAAMALRLNREMRSGELVLREGTLLTEDLDHPVDSSESPIHYLQPLPGVEGGVVTLLQVDQRLLDDLLAKGVNQEQLPSLGSAVMAFGRRYGGKFEILSLALGDRALVWSERLGVDPGQGYEVMAGPPPQTPEAPRFRLRPEAMMPLEENLERWLSGERVVRDEERFVSDGEPFRLGYLSEEYIDPAVRSSFSAVGVFLGSEEVGGEFVAYFGFEDSEGNHFYSPFSLGRLGDERLRVAIWRHPGRSLQQSGRVSPEALVSMDDLQGALDDFVGEVVMVGVNMSMAEYPPPPTDPQQREVFDQSLAWYEPSFESAQQINQFLYQAKNGDWQSLGVPSFLNRRYEGIGVRLPTANNFRFGAGMIA